MYIKLTLQIESGSIPVAMGTLNQAKVVEKLPESVKANELLKKQSNKNTVECEYYFDTENLDEDVVRNGLVLFTHHYHGESDAIATFKLSDASLNLSDASLNLSCLPLIQNLKRAIYFFQLKTVSEKDKVLSEKSGFQDEAKEPQWVSEDSSDEECAIDQKSSSPKISLYQGQSSTHFKPAVSILGPMEETRDLVNQLKF